MELINNIWLPLSLGLALILVFWVGKQILYMAFQAVRRCILNQHELLETGTFASILKLFITHF